MKMASKLLVYTAAATSNQMGGGFFVGFLQFQEEVSFFISGKNTQQLFDYCRV
ncbi:hypothetical protein ACFQY3_15380 [Paenibacillus farraposensis]|uniref:hypothetical protein n=1 Tax=Paenibacillus farraposensis TaxID=2807095 RepID=UPI00360742F7